jgi:hypothetical protein
MFYIIPLTDILIFAVPLYFAFRTRLDPPAHKRFIYIATIALLTLAIARLPFAFVYRKSPVVALLADSFLLVLVGYDLWSTRRIHRATLWAGSLLIFVLQIRVPIGKTAAWHASCRLGATPGWVRVHAASLRVQRTEQPGTEDHNSDRPHSFVFTRDCESPGEDTDRAYLD